MPGGGNWRRNRSGHSCQSSSEGCGAHGAGRVLPAARQGPDPRRDARQGPDPGCRFPQRAGFSGWERLFAPLDSLSVDQLVVSGAREHNLKDITVAIPRGSMTVITGLSGSGKSSLAFDTIYAEGQRRYVESLSAYARQFLGQMDKPDVDSIEGLSPAISIDQKTTSRNPRSTVGHGHRDLRLPAAAVGADRPPALPRLRPSDQRAVRRADHRPGDGAAREHAVHGAGADRPRSQGRVRQAARGAPRRRLHARARSTASCVALTRRSSLDKKYKHDIAIVVDRLVMKGELRKRLADSIETAVALADGLVEIELVDRDPTQPAAPGQIQTYSEKFACPVHGPSLVELEPRIFSFNSPHGACPRCTGLGSQMEIDPELVVPDPTLSIGEGAIAPWSVSASDYYDQLAQAIAERYRVDLETPWQDLSSRTARLLPVRDERRPGAGVLPQPVRPSPLLRDAVRGDRAEPRAPLQRDRVGVLAREDRGVHDAAAVPGLQGRAAAARVARGARSGHADSRVHGPVGAAGARVGAWARTDRARPSDRAARPAERSRSGCSSSRTSASGTCRWSARRRRCRAARRSGSGLRRRSAPRWSAFCTSSTSRRSGCTSVTTRS